MFERSEGYLQSSDGTQIYCQKWLKKNAEGTILITHGQGEHSNAYSRFIESFQTENWNIVTWDLRGHGHSDGRRGYVKNFEEYISDFNMVVDDLVTTHKKEGPIVLFSHSMGCLIQELALVKQNRKTIRGQILSAPLFGLTVEVPEYKAKAATLLNRFMPEITLGNELKYEMLTRDPQVIHEFEKDPHRHHKISSSAFLGMLDGFKKMETEAPYIDLPTLVIISENDPVVSTEAAKNIFTRLGSEEKTLKTYPHAKHELVNDIIRDDVFAFLKDYINSNWR